MEYRALNILALLYKIFAWVVLVGGSITSLIALFSLSSISRSLGLPSSVATGFLAFLFILGTAVFNFIFLLGLGEALSLLLEVDKNTKAVLAQASDKQIKTPKAA
jgi:hypothetical protein